MHILELDQIFVQDWNDFDSIEALENHELLIAFTVYYLAAFAHDSLTNWNHRIQRSDVFSEQIKIHIRHAVDVR